MYRYVFCREGWLSRILRKICIFIPDYTASRRHAFVDVCYLRRDMGTEIWWEGPEEIGHLEDIRIDGKIILKLILKTWMGGRGLDSAEDRNKWWAVESTAFSLKCWEFLE
jgi:hypothetical protein